MKKIVMFAVILAIVGSNFNNLVEAVGQSSNKIEQYNDAIDFRKDEKRAKEWAEETYEKWNYDLTRDEENSFNKLLTPDDYEINFTLKQLAGDLNNLPIDAPEIKNQYEKDIALIEKKLNTKDGKLKKSVYIYTNDTLTNLGNIDTDELIDIDNPNRLDEESAKYLSSVLGGGIYNEFLICDLSKKNNQENELIT